MKRALILLLLFIPVSSLSASVAPVSSAIGTVAVELEKGSSERLVWEAVRREYSDAWLEKYAFSPLSFALAYSSMLSSSLPLDDCLVSREKEGEVKVLDRKNGRVFTFIIKEGLIQALAVD